jgi:protein ImuB
VPISGKPEIGENALSLARGRSDAKPQTTSAEHALALATVAPVKSAMRLASVDDAAAHLGLRPGITLADARAMYPALAVADHDPAADHRLLAAIADWCDRYTPLAALDPPDSLVLDVTGCAHLFGGEAALCRDIVCRLAAQGFSTRVAVADTVGGAFAVAHHGTPSIVPPGGTREAVMALPLVALRIAADVVDGLAQAGLKRIADIIDRPRAPLAARFGEKLIRRLDQALGRLDEPITPRLPLPSCVAEQRFAEPIGLEGDVLGTIEHLAHELNCALERRGEGARLLQAALFRADGKVVRIEIGTGAPLRDAARVRRLFVDKLAAIADDWDPGFGFDVIRLAALATERLDPVQTGLESADHAVDLAHLVDRLGARFGLRRVTRLVPQDTHIPEFAVAAVPAYAARGVRRQASQQMQQHAQRAIEQDSLAPARPIRLFAQPEPIEATAEVPDGPPVHFRWRRVIHQVAHAEGPERIAMEWWRDDKGRTLTRDYFRVESTQGIRLWLYREGLFVREVKRPRWFVHGLFA